ncbi:MAG: Hint domain-containing protein [Candidatus Aureabacteria bacterium]|nr:Hint domain-containing protein [Candidatus Auribacterota bacterium]
MKKILVILFFLADAFTALGRGGGGCFEKGTPVLTPKGYVPIESLHEGDTVQTLADTGLQPVKILSCTQIDPAEYIEFAFGSGIVHVTSEHPFKIAEGTYRFAGKLNKGETVLSWNGNKSAAVPVISIKPLMGSTPAYNLIVEKGTFIAGDLLVHNKGCFLPDTRILRDDGTAVSISNIKTGDKLKAFLSDGTLVSAKVMNVIQHRVEEYIVVTTDKVVLNVTKEHPFYVGEGTFKTLEVLKTGDILFCFDGRGLSGQKIVGIKRVRDPVMVYNIQTDGPHTFFAAGIAVHNKGGGCLPSGTKIETPAGKRNIETLAPGDFILTKGQNGKPVSTGVRDIYAFRNPLVVIKTENGFLQATPDHPVAVSDSLFCNAGRLTNKDRVLMRINGEFISCPVQQVHVQTENTTVFNLSVDAPNTFIANGFLVHNKGGGFHSSSSYHRSGRSGARSRGGSGGEFSPLIIFIWFGIIIVVKILKSRENNQDENLDFCYSRSQIEKKAGKTQKLIEFISRQDQAFSVPLLEEMARSTFLKLQNCWQARNYEPMKSLMMPDLYSQHLKQISGMLRNHEINRMENIKIIKIDFVNVRYTNKPNQREFTVLFTAEMRDYYIDDRSERFLRGDTTPARFQEFWTFHFQENQWLLRDIEQTRESDVLKDENFFEQFTDHQVKEIYGEAVDKTGETGPWLDKKTETKAVKIERMLNFLYETDKLWGRDFMLARARNIFINVYMAREAGNLSDEIALQLFPDLAESLREEIKKGKEMKRTVEFRNFCVRKVELILIRNYSDNTQDEYFTRISFHAQKIVKHNGQILIRDEYVTPYEEYWTFGRHNNQWKLKEVLPSLKGRSVMEMENVDEEMGSRMVQWFYTKKRTL